MIWANRSASSASGIMRAPHHVPDYPESRGAYCLSIGGEAAVDSSKGVAPTAEAPDAEEAAAAAAAADRAVTRARKAAKRAPEAAAEGAAT